MSSLAAKEPYKLLRDHRQWGFIIYRCDYRDDTQWALFMERWSQRTNEWLIKMGERQLIENLSWTVREDRTSLNGATVETVRNLFTAWAKTEEVAAEQQTTIDLRIRDCPRYHFCIHIDAMAVDACLRFDTLPEDTQLKFWSHKRNPALGHAPYVTIIEKEYEVSENSYNPEEEEEDDDSDEEVEAISIKIHWQCVVPDIYSSLNQTSDSSRTFQSMAWDVDQDGVNM